MGDSKDLWHIVEENKVTSIHINYLIAAEVVSSEATQEASSLGYPSHRIKYCLFRCGIITILFCIQLEYWNLLCDSL